MLDQLVHNGVVAPDKEPHRGLSIVARGRRVALTPHQEEMGLAFARKSGTPYVEDAVFVRNFMQDWSDDLGISPPLTLDEVDLSELQAVVAAERAAKEALTPEERKALAAERKAEREALKARYGYAIVNGQRVELGTYMVEPSGIFMGRGQHPLRGRWKEGAAVGDITLNYGPSPEEMQGGWAEVVWQPESLWVARWKDKLTGKLKYIWLSDTAPIKQEREEQKFDQALTLAAEIKAVRKHIRKGLDSDDARTRQIATATYLIDALCLRVGDEKDSDEADTVGATTLRREHLTFHDDGAVEFRFLGKDSVEWHKLLKPDKKALRNLRALAGLDGQGAAADDAHEQLFPDVTSGHVNAFLSGVIAGLSAKVFRTHHATHAVRESLASSGVKALDADYVKWRAASVANLKAAELCNHTKQASGSWENTAKRYRQRIARSKERVARAEVRLAEQRERLTALQAEAESKQADADSLEAAEKVVARYAKRITAAQRRIDTAESSAQRARESLGKVQAQFEIAREKRTWNTSTSLKSYIDPRVYHRWGEAVEYDVLASYYPATLQRKFAWVRGATADDTDEHEVELTIRPCLPGDLVAVAAFFQRVSDEYHDLALPTQPADVAQRFMPRLNDEWRATRMVLGEEREVLGFVAVGPPWGDSPRCLDVFVVLDTDVRPHGLAYRVADEVEGCIEAYDVQHPRQRRQPETSLRPRDRAWLAYAPELEQALALGERQQDDADED